MRSLPQNMTSQHSSLSSSHRLCTSRFTPVLVLSFIAFLLFLLRFGIRNNFFCFSPFHFCLELLSLLPRLLLSLLLLSLKLLLFLLLLKTLLLLLLFQLRFFLFLFLVFFISLPFTSFLVSFLPSSSYSYFIPSLSQSFPHQS